MSRIKILPLHEAQKIAAGEVVERPANAVKELLENALDAGATNITLYLEAGGKQLIRIIDNGCGMNQDDARLCILPHATSKISSVDELHTLITFGFRGEALASLAAVSTMHLITRTQEMQEACKITLSAGTIQSEELVAGNKGTDITIENIFFNVPARKKFLKTDKTEWHAIQQLVQAYALDYPDVQFTLYHNKQRILSCAPCPTLEVRAQQIFDRTITEHMLAISSQETEDVGAQDIKIDGIISDHQFGRYDRSYIYLFVNKRWVKNYKLATAIIKGYQGVLQQGQFPCAVISLTLPLTSVDINIHPRKEEVQFLQPRLVEEYITALVRKRLEKHIAHRLQPLQATHIKHSPLPVTPWKSPSGFPTAQPFAPQTSHIPYQVHQEPFVEQTQGVLPAANNFQQEALHVQQHVAQEMQFTIKGQYNFTYILVDTQEGLLLIDQHAAHERILYEQIGAHLSQHELIRLLFPEQIRLSPTDYTLINEHLPTLRALGIEAEPWSDNQLLVTACPVYIKPHMLKDIVFALVDALKLESALSETAHKKIQHAAQAMMACKAAIKANDVLQPEEMQNLIKQLFATPNRLTCPHGRPTSWLLSIPEIERKFKRIT